MATKNHYT